MISDVANENKLLKAASQSEKIQPDLEERVCAQGEKSRAVKTSRLLQQQQQQQLVKVCWLVGSVWLELAWVTATRECAA